MLEQWIKENANMKDRGSVAVINDDVWILPPRCFSNMPGLKKVILPYNLRKIGAFSFAGCRSLEVSTFRGRLSSLTMEPSMAAAP